LLQEFNGAVGEESEEGTCPAAASAGASYLHPLVLEDSESDSEEQAWIHQPSSPPPEGSLLHAVYSQLLLLGAGFDGTAVLREPVRQLLKNRVVRKATLEKLDEALTEPTMEFEETCESMGDTQMPSWVGNNMTLQECLRGKGHTEKKAQFEKPIEALTEPEMEFEEALESMGNMQMPSWVGNNMTLRECLRGKGHTEKKVEFEIPLAELEMEFEEMHKSIGNMQMPSPIANQDDDSNGESKIVSTRHHVATKFQGVSWKRTTHCLPPHIGERKTLVKKNKGHLKNRLQ